MTGNTGRTAPPTDGVKVFVQGTGAVHMLGLCWGVPADTGVTISSAALLLPALVSGEWAQGHQGDSRSISR